jgi:hypothetical protein
MFYYFTTFFLFRISFVSATGDAPPPIHRVMPLICEMLSSCHLLFVYANYEKIFLGAKVDIAKRKEKYVTSIDDKLQVTIFIIHEHKFCQFQLE